MSEEQNEGYEKESHILRFLFRSKRDEKSRVDEYVEISHRSIREKPE